MVNKCIKNIQYLLYPATCILCGAPGNGGLDICARCLRELPSNSNCCRLCAAPVPSAASGGLCGECVVTPPLFDRCIAPFLYCAPIDSLISSFKFQQRLPNGRLLSLLLLDFLIRKRVEIPDIILPVPLHLGRLSERGFNQALEVARPLAKHFRLPLDLSTCVRSYATTPQMNLGKSGRLRNMRGAFEIRRDIDVQHAVLLDDVVTTGATVSELAALLKNRGVKKVDVWALARTP